MKPTKAWMIVEPSGAIYEPGEKATPVCKTRRIAERFAVFDQRVIRVLITPIEK